MANNNPTHVVTGKVRFSYEHLMEPWANTQTDPNAKPKYSVTVLLPKSDTATKARIDQAIHGPQAQAVRRAGAAGQAAHPRVRRRRRALGRIHALRA